MAVPRDRMLSQTPCDVTRSFHADIDESFLKWQMRDSRRRTILDQAARLIPERRFRAGCRRFTPRGLLAEAGHGDRSHSSIGS
jgi:hypothetical protein